jgi:hypothetical protein
MFNSQSTFVVPVISGGRKECRVRFPTDAEWCERTRKQRSVRRFLGRGKSEFEALDSSVIDVELLERIRQDKDGVLFDAAEAAAVLAKLERAIVDGECEREGDQFRVALRVPGAVVEHLVGIPTRKQMDKHEASSVKIVGARRAQEIRGFLEPSGELYDAIVKKSEGYVGPVPIVHKAAVISEVLVALAAEDEEALPEL